jgi:predicted transcriptional regulator YdeE
MSTNPTTIEIEEFKVIGISVRTTNQNGQSQNDIGNLWDKFMRQNLIEQIPNKNSDEVYCIYTNYESDFNGPYTTILGCKVDSFDNIPDGLIGWTITKSNYQVYKSTGKLPDSVVKTWTNIWQSEISRKYAADFDVYGQDSQNPENAEVDTYVSIK